MGEVEDRLAIWRTSAVNSITVEGLFARNPDVYKWKAPFRCWVLREAAFWRITDLLGQSLELHKRNHGLGARILLRSGFETLGSLLYLNFNMRAVVDGSLDFHYFDNLTARHVTGAKNNSTSYEAINVISMIEKGERRYPGLRSIFDMLSESAHPNFEGMTWGYSKVDHRNSEVIFSNRWMELHGDGHLGLLELCIETFQHEYDCVWPKSIDALEAWVEKNDTNLEATKTAASS